MIRFASAGIAGGYANPEAETPEGKGPYVRTLKDLDLSKESERQRVLDMIGVTLNDLNVRVVIAGDVDASDETAVASFVRVLRARSNLHFHAAGA